MVDTTFSNSYIETDAELEALIGANPKAAAIALKAAAAATQEWYCQEATRRIDQLTLRGQKYDTDIVAGVAVQPLQFPRIIDGVTCDWNDSTDLPIVPDTVKRACLLEAIALYAENSSTAATKRAELQEQGVKSYTNGKLSETYGPRGGGNSYGIQSPAAWRILSKYIARMVPIL